MPLTKEQEEKLREEFRTKFHHEDGLFNTKSGWRMKADPKEVADYWLSKINQIRDESLEAQRKEIVEGINQYGESMDDSGTWSSVSDILSLPQLTGKQEEDEVPNHQG